MTIHDAINKLLNSNKDKKYKKYKDFDPYEPLDDSFGGSSDGEFLDVDKTDEHVVFDEFEGLDDSDSPDLNPYDEFRQKYAADITPREGHSEDQASQKVSKQDDKSKKHIEPKQPT